MKHTSAPWEVNDEQPDVLFINDSNREICAIPLEDDNEEANEEIRANARLIAKAPEMFELIEKMWEIYNSYPILMEDEVTYNRIHKLIKEFENE